MRIPNQRMESDARTSRCSLIETDGRTLFDIQSSEEKDGLEAASTQKALVEDRERERLSNRLWTAFAVDPLEDGMSHPAEEIIGEALGAAEDKPVLD